jgi:Protein of unknown function (DUF3168).
VSFTNVQMFGADAAPNPFQVDLHNFLTAALSVQIQPRRASQNVAVYPYVTYFLVTSTEETQLNGSSGIQEDRWQFDAFSTNPLDCVVAIEQLKSTLTHYHGMVGGTEVLTITKINEMDMPSATPIDASDDGVYGKLVEFLIVHRCPQYNSD